MAPFPYEQQKIRMKSISYRMKGKTAYEMTRFPYERQKFRMDGSQRVLFSHLNPMLTKARVF